MVREEDTGAKQSPRAPGRMSRLGVYETLRTEIELLDLAGGLPSPIQAEGIWDDIWYAEAHNSTAIEGNTLVLREVEALLHDGRVLGEKQLSEYNEILGYADAARWVYRQALDPTWYDQVLLTLAEVRYVHRLAMEPVWRYDPHPLASLEEKPGNFRRHDIRPFPGGMIPTTWTKIDATMSTWVAKVCNGRDSQRPPVEVIADWFAEFERIHPFLDGNGRTGRLLTNLVLIRLGYPPVVIYKRQRTRYLRCLQRADEGVPGPLGEFLARAILDTLHQYFFPTNAGPTRLVPLASLADDDVTVRALSEAAARGRVRAQRGKNGQWQSTRQWVDDYKASRYRRS